MAVKGLGLDQTKGVFQAKGIVFGVKKDQFFKTGKAKNGKQYRTIHFGLKVSKDCSLFLDMLGMEKDAVYFYKKSDKKGEKGTTQKVEWSKRNTFSREGYRLIGVNLGITKKQDDKGEIVNDNQSKESFDACDMIAKNLHDGDCVFIKGNINYGHFLGKDGNVVRTQKLEPTQISLAQEINFDDATYEVVSSFTQPLIYMGIEKLDDGRGLVSAKIVNYSELEDANLFVTNPKLAKNISSLKPYTFISVFGSIQSGKMVEETTAEDDDGWGGSNPMNLTNSYKRDFVINGADPKTIDTDHEKYSEEIIEKALEAMKSNDNAKKEFGNDDEWGKMEDEEKGKEEELPW